MKEQNNVLVMGEVKIHSRKEVIAWVQSNGVYKFDELKNGLFFINLLTKLVPSDASKYKIYEKPSSTYEFTFNMSTVKRILNKHNFQMNLDVNALVNAKNCFQFANWFKNLYDQNKGDKEDEFSYTEKNYTPSKENSSFKYNSPALKNLLRATSSDAVSRSDKSKSMKKGNIIMKQFEKTEGLVLFPIPKHGRNFTMKIKENSYKMKTMGSNEKQSPPKKISQSQFIGEQRQKEEEDFEVEDSETDIMNLLKMQALKDSIQAYEGILAKIDELLNVNKGMSLNEMRKNITDIIYMKK